MKIPSLKVLFEGAKETFLRYPFVILVSAIGAAFMMYIVDQPFERQEYVKQLYNVVISCSVGISFLLALVFITERAGTSKAISVVIQLIGIVILTAYYFSLPKEVGYIDITRYFLFIIGAHLLVSFSPYVKKGFSLERRGFWQFNQSLFERILITAVYSGVLYAGLSIAILSFDTLFDVQIDSKRYLQLFFFILGVFNTWFFLSGLPKNFEELDTRDLYTKGVKVFTQYVLLPLVFIYLLILYMYMGKIIIQWQLPMGWVSYLVLGFSITGIFSLLLIEPLKGTEGNNWIKIFSKWYYLVLFPLIVLLFVAILRRTGEYGITERRYFVFVLAVWLTFIALYFSISKVKNIKIIPYSLCIIAFLTSFGPWGAFSVSERSQIGRLEEILVNNKILIEGKILKANIQISEEEGQDVSSIINFLKERNSLDRIQPWFDMKIDTINSSMENGIYKSQVVKIMDLMGIKYVNYRKNFREENKNLYVSLREYGFVNVKNYDYMLKYFYNLNDREGKINQHRVDSTHLISFEFNPDESALKIKDNDIVIEKIVISDFIESIRKVKSEPTMKDMSIDGENEKIKYKIVVINLSCDKEEDKEHINLFNVEVFLKFK